MAITTIPAKTALSLGEPLTNTRTPEANEASAVNYEQIKTRVIEIFTEVGLSDGSTANSINSKLKDAVLGPGSATANTIVAFDGTTGKLVKATSVPITSTTVDGRDVSVDGAKLDGIESGADVTDTANVSAAGAVMASNFNPAYAGFLGRNPSGTLETTRYEFSEVSGPSGSDDVDQGYREGSIWIDLAIPEIYMCVDAGDPGTDSADWVLIYPQSGGGGSGDVVGPASATDNAVVRFNLTTGKLVQDSLFIVNDSGDVTASGLIRGRDIEADGTKLDGIESGADVTDAANVAAAGAVMDTREIATTAPLTGGGTLDGDLTIAMPAATVMVNGYATSAQITVLEALDANAIRDADFGGSATGSLVRTGAGTYAVIRDVTGASGAPVSTDDSSDGYSVGSRWIDTMNDHAYVCVDDTENAAVWLQLDGGGGGGSGDVVGPASAADNSIAVFDGTDGKQLADSGVPISGGLVDGRDLAADGAKLDGIEAFADVTDATNVAMAGAVMASARSVISGGGLTGGGNLTADRTLAVGANADGSIVVNADDIQVGVINETQHGDLDGGSLHALATASPEVAGFLSGADKGKLDSLKPVTIDILSGTSMTVADTDHQKVIRCTSATTVTVSVPSGLTPGTTVEFLQEAAGQVQLVGSGSPTLTLRLPSGFSAYTKAQWSTIVVTILDNDEAVVRGHLA